MYMFSHRTHLSRQKVLDIVVGLVVLVYLVLWLPYNIVSVLVLFAPEADAVQCKSHERRLLESIFEEL